MTAEAEGDLDELVGRLHGLGQGGLFESDSTETRFFTVSTEPTSRGGPPRSSHMLIHTRALGRKREMTDDVRALAQRMYEAFNTRDLTAAKAIFSADFVSHPLGTVGVDSVVKAWSGLHTMFPDIQVIVEDMLVDADKAAVRTSLHGIPAGGGEQALPSMMEIFRVRDGRIAELWGLSSLSRPGS
ncbi:ester cyclase [Streptomyces sp. NPDC057052]|uniref:ester cyclase n=1 Tax=Streptomyces sp. NPDC057052 TaxID=3346010 RepID=UPI003624B028